MNATPAAAKLAKQLGVALDQVEGTGKGGRITVTDVREAAKQRKAEAFAAAGARVVSVFGAAQHRRALIVMPLEAVETLIGDPDELAGNSVVTAVEEHLEELRKVAPVVAESPEAATALELARQLDHPWNSAHSKSLCARALIDALEKLRERAPEQPEGDRLDDLAAKHARRRARLPGAANPASARRGDKLRRRGGDRARRARGA